MDIGRVILRFDWPDDWEPPTLLTFEDVVARPLTRADLAADLRAVNSSAEIIRETRGGSWPHSELSEEFDFLDLAWHEREFAAGSSFAYVIYDSHERYIGCLYLYPMGMRTQLTEDLLPYEVDASWWVTTDAYAEGYYRRVFNGIRELACQRIPVRADLLLEQGDSGRLR